MHRTSLLPLKPGRREPAPPHHLGLCLSMDLWHWQSTPLFLLSPKPKNFHTCLILCNLPSNPTLQLPQLSSRSGRDLTFEFLIWCSSRTWWPCCGVSILPPTHPDSSTRWLEFRKQTFSHLLGWFALCFYIWSHSFPQRRNLEVSITRSAL